MSPSAIYRQTVRWGCHYLSTYEERAILLGTPINSLLLADLEAFYELVFGCGPRRLAPLAYRPTRP